MKAIIVGKNIVEDRFEYKSGSINLKNVDIILMIDINI